MVFFKDQSVWKKKYGAVLTVLSVFAATMLVVSGCGEEKIIIRYLKPPSPVELISPPVDTFITTANPTFIWHPVSEAIRYQIQVATSSNFINTTINTNTAETTYTTISQISNNTYFWRVRAQNEDTLWGDWSDADIWTFYKSDYVNYINPLSSINTYGNAQDVFVRGDTAYVADGQADLTTVNVVDKSYPLIIWNWDTIDDDFANSVYVAEADTFPYAFVADMDGHIQAINTADTTFLYNNSFGSQNLEDIDAAVITDTLYIFAVRSRSGFNLSGMSIFQIVFDPYPRESGTYVVNPIDMPANSRGVRYGGDYAYVACDEVGLRVIDISDIYNPFEIAGLPLGGAALAVDVKDNYVYVAADRNGLYVVDVTTPASPAVAAQVNTSGRTRDVHVTGSYAFIADGSGGLKVIDIAVPDSAHFVAAYDTPYANGVWADENYVYLCDRDDGLIIMENLVSR
jgi:hypothetical protein